MGAFDIELLFRGLYPSGLYPSGEQAGQPAGSVPHPASAARPARRAVPRHPAVWRLGERPMAPARIVPCGIPELEQQLPGKGWPPGCITEVISQGAGIGEVSLLLPALAGLSRQAETVVWVAPPCIPYPPALRQAGVELGQMLWVDARNEADALWAAEQSLRSGTCGAVLVWLTVADHTALRRLQLAAEAGGALCFVLRDRSRAAATSPAAVRVAVESDGRRRQLRLLKCRGSQGAHVSLAA